MNATENGRSAWLKARRAGIGGSDAAAACGLSPWKTPYQLYREKTGEVADDFSASERARWGVRLEDAIATEYAERHGYALEAMPMLAHPRYPFMLANVDRRIVGAERGLEIKTVDRDVVRASDEWGESGSDRVPMAYRLQVQHYLAVTGWDAFDLAALVGGNELREYEIARDDDLIASLIELEAEFWARVQRRDPPPPTSVDEARERFPRSQAKAIGATAEIADACRTLRGLKADAKELEEQIEALSATVLAYLGEHDTLTYGGATLATWKTSKPSVRLDEKRLRAEAPETAALYSREIASRRFLLKGEPA